MPFVVDAVYAFAHALHALQRDTCSGNGTCSSMLNMDGGSFYYNYLLKVNFTGECCAEFGGSESLLGVK